MTTPSADDARPADAGRASAPDQSHRLPRLESLRAPEPGTRWPPGPRRWREHRRNRRRPSRSRRGPGRDRRRGSRNRRRPRRNRLRPGSRHRGQQRRPAAAPPGRRRKALRPGARAHRHQPGHSRRPGDGAGRRQRRGQDHADQDDRRHLASRITGRSSGRAARSTCTPRRTPPTSASPPSTRISRCATIWTSCRTCSSAGSRSSTGLLDEVTMETHGQQTLADLRW